MITSKDLASLTAEEVLPFLHDHFPELSPWENSKDAICLLDILREQGWKIVFHPIEEERPLYDEYLGRIVGYARPRPGYLVVFPAGYTFLQEISLTWEAYLSFKSKEEFCIIACKLATYILAN